MNKAVYSAVNASGINPGYPLGKLCTVNEQPGGFTVSTQLVPENRIDRTQSSTVLFWLRMLGRLSPDRLIHIFTDHNNQSTTASQRIKRC